MLRVRQRLFGTMPSSQTVWLCVNEFDRNRFAPFQGVRLLVWCEAVDFHRTLFEPKTQEIFNQETGCFDPKGLLSCTTKIFEVEAKRVHFSKILISAVKSNFSHSNHHKNIKELLWRSFLKICFSPYITHREAIEVQKQFLGKLSKFQQNEQYLRICMELRFQIWSTHTLT